MHLGSGMQAVSISDVRTYLQFGSVMTKVLERRLVPATVPWRQQKLNFAETETLAAALAPIALPEPQQNQEGVHPLGEDSDEDRSS